MGNCFDFTFVKKKCRFDQGFAVTGGAGKSNFCIFRKKAVNLLDEMCIRDRGYKS